MDVSYWIHYHLVLKKQRRKFVIKKEQWYIDLIQTKNKGYMLIYSMYIHISHVFMRVIISAPPPFLKSSFQMSVRPSVLPSHLEYGLHRQILNCLLVTFMDTQWHVRGWPKVFRDFNQVHIYIFRCGSISIAASSGTYSYSTYKYLLISYFGPITPDLQHGSPRLFDMISFNLFFLIV